MVSRSSISDLWLSTVTIGLTPLACSHSKQQQQQQSVTTSLGIGYQLQPYLEYDYNYNPDTNNYHLNHFLNNRALDISTSKQKNYIGRLDRSSEVEVCTVCICSHTLILNVYLISFS